MFSITGEPVVWGVRVVWSLVNYCVKAKGSESASPESLLFSMPSYIVMAGGG